MIRRVPPRTARTTARLGACLAVVGLVLASITVAAVPATAQDTGAVRTQDLRIAVRDGPARDQAQSLDATLYLPARTPAPAVLVAHGFGGSKRSVDADARALATRGYVALAWSAQGFGASTGRIGLDAPEYEVTDASQLVDWLAARPEVRLDAPGDPRVGVTGESYGGALALLLSAYDHRVDASVPVITWNDLGQALFPNDAGPPGSLAATPAAGAGAPDGVFKRSWAALFFGSGSTPLPGVGGPPDVCGRFRPEICRGYVAAVTSGRLPPDLAALLARSSPASVAGRITAPTLLVQGERDTLFGLDQADATARAIAAGGGRVAVSWFAGGHDGGGPDAATTARMDAWFDHHLAGTATDPGTAFTYAVPSGVQARRAPTQRIVTSPAYPGLAAGATARESLALTGDAQDVVAPAGGQPAALSSLPGLGAAAGGSGAGEGDDDGGSGGGSGGGGGGGGGGGVSSVLGRLASDLPGQAATFSTAPLASRTVVAGSPRVALDVTPVGTPADPGAGAVLYAKVYDVAPDGSSRTLLGSAVSPVRVTGLPRTVEVGLPGVVATIAAGHRLQVAVSTTDQAYASPALPAVYRVGRAPGPDGAALSVPVVAGEVRSGTSVPLAPLVAAGAVLLAVALAVVLGRVLTARRRRRDTEPGGALAVENELVEVPLVVRGLVKTFPNGLRAVDDVSFTVGSGQVLGLLGPNGAGKTTTLRMLLGLVTPDAGELRIFGRRVVPGAPVLGRLGAFVEGAGFLPHLSGRANLEQYWAATGRPPAEAHLDDALAIAGLGAAIDRTVRTYSQGMRQRLAIAQAMLGLPDLLVLDEPTNGLDPPQIHAMRDVLRSYAAGGRTVLVSSHLLAEVEQTCSHVVVMHRGAVVAAGEVAELVAGGQVAISVRSRNGVVPTEVGQRAVRAVAGVGAVSAQDGGGDGDGDDPVLLVDLRDADRGAVVRALVEAGLDVTAVGPRRRLEDAFLALIGEEGTP